MAVLLVLVLIGLAVWNPAVALLAYAIVAADADGFGVQQFASTYLPEYRLLTRFLYLVLALWMGLRLLRPSAESIDPLMRRLSGLGIALSLWIVISSLLKGHEVVYSLSLLAYSGLPALLIWLAAGRGENGRRLFIGFILIQILIAFGTLTVPAMQLVDGATYAANASPNLNLNLALPTDGTLKLVAGGHYGQFHNPNVLGFYASVSLACGFALLRYRRSWSRSLAVVLLSLGTVGWLNSLTRGVMLGLLLGLGLSVLAVWRAKDRAHALNQALILVATLAAALSLAVLAPGTLSYLIPDASDRSVEGRLPGFENGFAAIAQHPWLGVGVEWDWTRDGVPHFLGLFFAGQYGLVGGTLVMLASFGVGAVVIGRAVRGARSHMIEQGPATLAILLVLVVWGIAATNNLAAPVLFWVCLAEAAIISSPNAPQRAVITRNNSRHKNTNS